MHSFTAGGINLTMSNPAAGCHRLHFARANFAISAGAVAVAQRAFDHPGNDLHVLMAVLAEAASRLDNVVVDHSQGSVSHILRIVVAAEGKRMAAVEPADFGCAALPARANLKVF